MEPKGSLPHSQVPANRPYPEPHRSGPCPHIPLLEDPSQYYPSIYPGPSKWSLSLTFSHQTLYTHLLCPYVLHHPPTSFFLILSPEQHVLGEHTSLTLRRLMSYIYMEHPFLMFLDHTQRRSTVGRTPLDE